MADTCIVRQRNENTHAAEAWDTPLAAAALIEPPRTVPLIQDVGVLVVGGTPGAVAVAQAAASKGASVFLVTDQAGSGAGLYWIVPQPVWKATFLLGGDFTPCNI